MAERRLDFNAIEARGIFLLQQSVLQAATQAEQAAAMLAAQEQDAADTLKGRLPEGSTVRDLRIDQKEGAVYLLEKK